MDPAVSRGRRPGSAARCPSTGLPETHHDSHGGNDCRGDPEDPAAGGDALEDADQTTFESVPDLVDVILEYLDHENRAPRPFVWTNDASTIWAKIDRAKSCLNVSHV